MVLKTAENNFFDLSNILTSVAAYILCTHCVKVKLMKYSRIKTQYSVSKCTKVENSELHFTDIH